MGVVRRWGRRAGGWLGAGTPNGLRGAPAGAAAADPWDLFAICTIVFGDATRFVWGLVTHPAVNFVYSDMAGYVNRAQSLASHWPKDRIDALFPPGTHMVLAVPMLVFGTGRTGLWAGTVMWTLMGAATPWLAWRWLLRVIPRPAAALAAAACAVWPLYVTQVGWFMSEVPSLFLLLAGLLLATQISDTLRSDPIARGIPFGRLVLAGIVIGLGIDVRPQLVLNFGLALMLVVWTLRRTPRPLVTLGVACLAPIALAVALDTSAAGHPSLLSEIGGVDFFMAQCNAGHVITATNNSQYFIASPVFVQAHEGRTFFFPGHHVWDQGFFVSQALDCLRRRGIHQAPLIGQHVLDLTVTSVPWPQSDDAHIRGLIRVTNNAYALLLPSILIVGVFSWWAWRREPRGAAIGWLVAHLLCVLPTVLVFVSEPRYRAPYDVFGFAIASTVVIEWIRARRPAELTTDPPHPPEVPVGV